MRGSRIFSIGNLSFVGIIPAHAGLTRGQSSAIRLKRDHPRACGAHVINNSADEVAKGSSPRMRGSRVVPFAISCSDGIIPAHAGLTAPSSTPASSCRDHPRACGAHAPSSRPRHPRPGSSPRMRGSRIDSFGIICAIGIIPAHAGLTLAICCVSGLIGDHPRACGAHGRYCPKCCQSQGSSPRMRGSPQLLAGRAVFLGIIPAHAGLTFARPKLWKYSRDHPRACGAHDPAWRCPGELRGSSPRMRGSRGRRTGGHPAGGIIPAHAGLTQHKQCPMLPPRDHPRACGAHIKQFGKMELCEGSSPRMRGSQARRSSL